MKLQKTNGDKGRKLTVLLISSAFVAYSMAADVFYVATNGVDAVGRGSEESPFETIQYAIDSASSGSTIWVKPGIYDKGGAESTNTTTHLNRVVLTKVIHLKSTDGAAVTHIVGAPDPDTGDVGPKAVRCIISPSDNKALDSTITGFTLRDGYGDDGSTGHNHRSGGFLQHHGRKEIYISDCVISNCMSFSHGGARGGTFSRCLFANNRVTTGNNGNDAAGVGNSYLVHCMIASNGDGDYDYAVGDSSKLVNCTVVCNRGRGCASTCILYNTVVCGNSNNNYPGTSATNSVVGGYPVYSPIDGDYRIVVGSAADNAGNPAYLLQGTRPFTMLSGMENKDLAGNTVDTSAEHIHVGAIQATTAATTEGGTLYLYGPLSFNGLHVPAGVPTYGQNTNCLTQWHIQFDDINVSGTTTNYMNYIHRRVGNAANASILNPARDNSLVMMVPTVAGVASTNTPKYTKARWVDPVRGNDTANDGSETAPYATIQKAVGCGNETVVFLEPGIYATGGFTPADTSVAPYENYRVWITNHYVRLLGKGGAENTIIAGAADPITKGMGDGAYCCVGGNKDYITVSGVTLSNGWTRADDVVTASGYGAAVFGSGVNIMLFDSVVTDCHGYRSVLRYTYAYRCKIYGNESMKESLFASGGGRAICSWLGPNKAKSSSYYGYLGSSVVAYFCTLVMEDGKSLFSQSASLYNCIAVNGQYVKSAMNSKGNLFWNFAEVDAAAVGTFTNEKPRLRGDKMHVSITSPALTAGVAPSVAGYAASDPISVNWFTFSSTDMEGNLIRFNADGTAMAGAFQYPVPVRLGVTISLK
jgi:hypothetical protein